LKKSAIGSSPGKNPSDADASAFVKATPTENCLKTHFEKSKYNSLDVKDNRQTRFKRMLVYGRGKSLM